MRLLLVRRFVEVGVVLLELLLLEIVVGVVLKELVLGGRHPLGLSSHHIRVLWLELLLLLLLLMLEAVQGLLVRLRFLKRRVAWLLLAEGILLLRRLLLLLLEPWLLLHLRLLLLLLLGFVLGKVVGGHGVDHHRLGSASCRRGQGILGVAHKVVERSLRGLLLLLLLLLGHHPSRSFELRLGGHRGCGGLGLECPLDKGYLLCV